MSADRYPKKQQTDSKISSTCGQRCLNLIFHNCQYWNIGFLKAQFFQNLLTHEIGILYAIYPKKQLIDSYILNLLRHAQLHLRYCKIMNYIISNISWGMKWIFCMLVENHISNLSIKTFQTNILKVNWTIQEFHKIGFWEREPFIYFSWKIRFH